jgi:AcrR family transcriptional regulator
VQRNREETRAAILAAVGQLLARSGFSQIGINSVARQAGVDKVLIYRYFGGLPELLKAFAEEGDFWPGISELMSEANKLPAAATAAESAKRAMLAFGRALRKRPLTQEIMRWELQERNELTETLARYREEQSVQLLRQFEIFSGVDVNAIASLLSAGQTYLVLRSKSADIYNGLSLHSDHDWARLEAAVCSIIDAVFATAAAKEGNSAGQRRSTGRQRSDDKPAR